MKPARKSRTRSRAFPWVITLVAVGCSMDHRGLDGLVISDAGAGGAGGTGGKGGAQVGGAGGSGGGLLIDAPPGLGGAGGQVVADGPVDEEEPVDMAPEPSGNGQACTGDSECGSGHCVDGLCCESACDQPCSACVGERTGGEDGDCRPIAAGTDPDEECAAEPGNVCGRTGQCGGGRACAVAATTKVCGDASCVGQTLTPAPLCDGAGACKPRSATACPGSLRCESPSACRTRCTSNNQCTAGSYCDVDEGQCRPGKALGAACAGDDDGQCASGHCVDGVCCDSACGSLCNACTQARTGVQTGKCAPVKVGTDPDNECRRDEPSSCGQDGMCNGAGACRDHADGTTCGTACCQQGRGGRPCTFACKAGRCDTADPTPGQACGNFACCCPTGGANGEAACVSSSLFGCPAGCQ